MVSPCNPLFITGRNDDGEIVAVAAGTIWRPRVLPLSRFCAMATLFALPQQVGGTLADGCALLAAIERRLRVEGVFSLRITSYDSPHSGDTLSEMRYQLSDRFEFRIDLTRSELEIWEDLKGERRTDIRKAERLGVVTRRSNTSEALGLLEGFVEQSMARRGISAQSYARTMEAEQRRLASGMIDVFVSYHEGIPVNAAMFACGGTHAYYHVSGASQHSLACRGPAHLIWTAIKYYREMGMTCLNLGASLPGQEGLYRFKRDFGADVVPAPIGRKRISTVGSVLHTLQSVLNR